VWLKWDHAGQQENIEYRMENVEENREGRRQKNREGAKERKHGRVLG
jgi:hypothetical protein